MEIEKKISVERVMENKNRWCKGELSINKRHSVCFLLFRLLFSTLFYRITFYYTLIWFFSTLMPSALTSSAPPTYSLVSSCLVFFIFLSFSFSSTFLISLTSSPFSFLFFVFFPFISFSARQWQKLYQVVGNWGTFFKKQWKRAWRLQRREINRPGYRFLFRSFLFLIICLIFGSFL